MQIEVLSVSVEDKGKYKMAEVAYKNQEGKVMGKKLMSFGDGAKAFKLLASASAGEMFTVKAAKNDKGFWDWVDAEKGAVDLGTTSKPAAPAGNATPRSTYETPDERALRQKLIVRQSSITAALELVKLNNPKGGVDPQQVVDVAQFFDNWVWNKAKSTDSIEELKSDVPF